MARNFPHAILYGPNKFNGAGFQHPFYHSGIEKICTMIQECTQLTQTGNLIQAVSEGFRLELGFNTTLGTIRESEFKRFKKFVSPCWYDHVLKFFISMNDPAERIELIEDTPLMPALRENDTYIMKEFLDAGDKDDELKILNYMRMNIKAVTLADVTTPNGRSITFDV